MPTRTVRHVLKLPFLAAGVTGGGVGSRHTRRVAPQTRNAVAILRALGLAGVNLELATNILGETPIIVSMPTEVVDFRDMSSGVCPLAIIDPAGGWLPTDVVPGHVMNRFVFPCVDESDANPGPGDIFEIPADTFKPGADGAMTIDRSAIGRSNLRLRSRTATPVYSGEIDPLGLYIRENRVANALPRYDVHLLIVNAKWVFLKTPEPDPLHAMHEMMLGQFHKGQPVNFDLDPVSLIEDDGKTVRTIGWGRDEAAQERARYHLDNALTLLDVNLTLAVRTMKRRAYDLPVEGMA